MALVQEIFSGKWADYMRRKFLMRGPLRVQLPGDIQPVIDLDHVEQADRFAMGEELISPGLVQGAVVGALSRVALSIAAGASLIAEIDALLIGEGTTGQGVDIRHDGVQLAGFNPFQRDDSRSFRWSALLADQIQLENDTAAVTTGTLASSIFVPVGVVVIPILKVLTPGHRLNVNNTVVNTALSVSFLGRVRRSEPGEL